jgi:hypothetical protein
MGAHRYIADKVSFKFGHKMVHICFTSGDEDFEFTTPVSAFLKTTLRAQEKCAKWRAEHAPCITELHLVRSD